ncbi:MAG TPA: trypsin-like peptidase domain-containing protein, partial [Gemmataceae bacterium]|nr:trypsin-like peptidase domain-containing protein [Gemmataceae bacterium]
MHTTLGRGVLLVVLAAGFLCGAGTEAKGQYNRRTAVVEAVEKTRGGVIVVKVEKKSQWGRKEVIGTGIIVDERGYAITNRHVVNGYDKISVSLFDGTEVGVQVLVEDPSYDLAILRLKASKPLQALPLGPSGDVMVGEDVIAIGHPHGYNYTVSTGIISAVGRSIDMPSGETLKGLFQTNAAINPGNSGGPLLNINGEIIGINTALREGSQNMAFALNADLVQQALSKHLSALKVSGVSLGLSCSEAMVRDGRQRQKVLVQEAAAGLEKGDELLRVGDRPVGNRFDVERALWDCKAGDKVTLAVVHEGREMTVSLTLAGGSRADAGNDNPPNLVRNPSST